MLSNVVLRCTVCGHENVVPRLHSNMLAKDGASTFCSNCNTVTAQKVGGSTHGGGGSAARDASPQPTQPIGGAGKMGAVEAAIWRQFEEKLRQNHLTKEDVFRCDAQTQWRLLQSLQIPASDQTVLVELIQKNNPFTPAKAPSSGVVGAGGGGGGALVPVAASSVPGTAMGSMTSPPSHMSSHLPAASSASGHHHQLADVPAATLQPQQTPLQAAVANMANQSQLVQQPSPIRGLQISGDQIIAQCSVYPNQPAEYWCAACNVLVSSRCHVQGIHKDHPFISLRLAAEAHVRDLTAWAERCRNQLNVTQSVMNNLQHAETLLVQHTDKQNQALDEHVELIYQDLLKWRDQLKADMSHQVSAQQTAIRHASVQAEQLHNLYSAQLANCEPLVTNIPPPETADLNAQPPANIRQDTWALRILDLVSKLKLVSAEPIPMPRITVPSIVCNSTPSTHMELIKASYAPLGVRLPEMVDPAFFNFPHAGGQRRAPFTLQGGDDALSKGILIHNGRTLTRSQDVVPSHLLVSGSQVFYSGVTTWEVHVDSLGSGPGRVLLGVVVHGTEGEGVVWDGHRIVGPNEGECRVIDERYLIQPGTILRLHLELEPPSCFLRCFINREPVAKIPLPATGQGWVPAFSVFGPQDQITITPTSSTQLPGAASEIASMSTAAENIVQEASGRQQMSAGEGQRTAHLIASLQQQIQNLSERVTRDENSALMMQEASPHQLQPAAVGAPAARALSHSPKRKSQPASPQQQDQRTYLPAAVEFAGSSSTPRQGLGAAPADQQQPTAGGGTSRAIEAYSPELKQLMRYVSDVPH